MINPLTKEEILLAQVQQGEIKLSEFLDKIKDIEPKFNDIVNENFWELLNDNNTART